MPNFLVIIRWLLRDVTLTIVVCSVAGSFGSLYFLLDLLSHFRCQYLALLAVLAALLWRMNSPRWAALALLGVIHNAILVGPYYLPPRGSTKVAAIEPESRTQLTLISFNVHTANRRTAAVLDYLQHRDADLILLTEVDHRWIHELAPLLERYPHTALAPQADNFGIALYSKLPLTQQQIAGLGPDQPLSIWAELDIDGRRLLRAGRT